MRRHSPETIQKISLAQMGKKNSFYGHTHDKVALRMISEANTGKKNPMFGKKHSAATKEKIRQAALRRFKAAR